MSVVFRERPGFRAGLTVLAFAVALALFTSSSAAAQAGHSVRGRVVERGTDRGIAQAAVSLADGRTVRTNAQGEFVLANVAPGRHGVTVEAIGYRLLRTTVIVVDDVTGTLQMDPEPVQLDTIGVRIVRRSVRGRVMVEGTTQTAPFVTVKIEGVGETSTNTSGAFRLNGLFPGRYVVTFEGFGWLPQSVPVDVHSDTTINVTLVPDPITEANIAQQIARIDERAKGYFPEVFDQADLMRSRAATPVETIRLNPVPCPGSRIRACTGTPPREPFVYIDDRLVHCGLTLLAAYPVDAIRRIELYSGPTIRVYSIWYIENLVARRTLLPLIGPIRGA